MIGSGGDKAAREDMFPTQVPDWQTEQRVGSPPIGKGSSFDVTDEPDRARAEAARRAARGAPAALDSAGRSSATRRAPSSPSAGSTRRRSASSSSSSTTATAPTSVTLPDLDAVVDAGRQLHGTPVPFAPPSSDGERDA